MTSHCKLSFRRTEGQGFILTKSSVQPNLDTAIASFAGRQFSQIVNHLHEQKITLPFKTLHTTLSHNHILVLHLHENQTIKIKINHRLAEALSGRITPPPRTSLLVSVYHALRYTTPSQAWTHWSKQGDRIAPYIGDFDFACEVTELLFGIRLPDVIKKDEKYFKKALSATKFVNKVKKFKQSRLKLNLKTVGTVLSLIKSTLGFILFFAKEGIIALGKTGKQYISPVMTPLALLGMVITLAILTQSQGRDVIYDFSAHKTVIKLGITLFQSFIFSSMALGFGVTTFLFFFAKLDDWSTLTHGWSTLKHHTSNGWSAFQKRCAEIPTRYNMDLFPHGNLCNDH